MNLLPQKQNEVLAFFVQIKLRFFIGAGTRLLIFVLAFQEYHDSFHETQQSKTGLNFSHTIS